MTSPGRGTARVLRGSLLALCCTLLALAGHAAGGGRVTAVLPMLAGAAALAAAFSVWADRRRGPVEIVAVVRLPVVPHRLSGRRPAGAAPAGCGAGIVLAVAHRRRGPPRLDVVPLATAR